MYWVLYVRIHAAFTNSSILSLSSYSLPSFGELFNSFCLMVYKHTSSISDVTSPDSLHPQTNDGIPVGNLLCSFYSEHQLSEYIQILQNDSVLSAPLYLTKMNKYVNIESVSCPLFPKDCRKSMKGGWFLLLSDATRLVCLFVGGEV